MRERGWGWWFRQWRWIGGGRGGLVMESGDGEIATGGVGLEMGMVVKGIVVIGGWWG